MAHARLWQHAAVAAAVALILLCPGCQCWPYGSAVDDPSYQDGMRLFLAGQHSAAAPLLREFVAQWPYGSRTAEARYALGAIALRSGQTHEAETQFRECLNGSPSDELAAGAALGLARCRFQRGDYRQCREACFELLREEPQTPRADEILLLAAEASDRAGLTAEARTLYRQIATEFPASPCAQQANARLGGEPGVPSAEPGGRYHVQVAALSSANRAAEHARLLRDRGYPAHVVETRAGSDTLHAVRVGPFATEADARRVAAKLRAEGFEALIKP